MDKKEIQAKVRQLLAAGAAKAEVFAQLSGEGAKDSQLAYSIASYADPIRCDEHARKVNTLVTIMFIQAMLAFLIGFAMGAQVGPNARWAFGALAALIPSFLAWGFYTHRVGAYNAYIVLTFIQIPNSIKGFASDPITTAISLAISIALLAFVWYVREKIFPDFSFFVPKKIKGEYVFSG